MAPHGRQGSPDPKPNAPRPPPPRDGDFAADTTLSRAGRLPVSDAGTAVRVCRSGALRERGVDAPNLCDGECGLHQTKTTRPAAVCVPTGSGNHCATV
eukprot:363329-Chlamydomonas_euryale.AAC.3